MFSLILIHFSHINKNKRKYFFKISTKVTLYAIWKDTTPPVIGTLTFSPTGNTQGDVTLTGKATDLGSGISYYQFSTNGNLTSSSSGWTSITNTTKEITQTYTVVNNGTYYFYAKDDAGNINKKAIVISNIRYVAQIGDIKYRTLREAIEAVKTDETILMIGDTTENNTVSEDKKFTLDLGEQTITGMFINNGNLAIIGSGTIQNTNLTTLINNGTLNINGGTIKVTNNNTTETMIAVLNYATVNMSGGTITGSSATAGVHSLHNYGTFNGIGGTISLASGPGSAVMNYFTFTASNMTITSSEFGLVTIKDSSITDTPITKVTGGSISTTSSEVTSIALLVRQGKAETNSTIISATSGYAVYNETGVAGNLLIRSRATNYGLTGNLPPLTFVATTNTGPGQSLEQVTFYNTGCEYTLSPVWSDNGGQDDITWTSSRVSSNNSSHTFTIRKSDHKDDSGTYQVELYESNSSWSPVRWLTGIQITF